MIPVCRPDTTEVEKKWVMKALEENALSSRGGFTDYFETKFAEKVGAKYALAVNSGGSALFLALWSLGIRKGDEVILPTFTMVATGNAILQCGAKPIFVDCEPDTGNIDAFKIEEKITKKTKAIIVVHIYGHPCDMDAINKIAKEYNLFVVEDAAEAHGAEYKGKMVGSLADVACFSFYANKIITTGEGGMITTDNEQLAKDIVSYREYDMTHNTHFWHTKVAWNLRLSSLQAAYGIGQLERWDELILKRRLNADVYSERLINCVETPVERPYAKNVFWMYFIRTDKRDMLETFLAKNEIETRRAFTPLHIMPHLKQKEDFYDSERLWKRGLYLPSSSDLKLNEIDYICGKVRDFCGRI